MAFTTPYPWAVGEMANAVRLNASLRDNLLASEAAVVTTAGDLVVGTGVGTVARVATGASGTFLRAPDAGTAPSWVDSMAWRVDVNLLSGGAANSNWNDTRVGGLFGGDLQGAVAGGGSPGETVDFPIVLSAGTWTCRVTHIKNTTRGIVSVQLDGVEVGTVDMYNASLVNAAVADVTGIVVATGGKKTFRMAVNAKNASATAYIASIEHVTWFRTA